MALRDEQIRAFVGADEFDRLEDAQSGKGVLPKEQQDNINRYFERQREVLSEWGLLPTGPRSQTNLRNTSFDPVRQRKNGYVPFMISLVPPEVYPSGDFNRTTIPSPQDASVRVRMQRETVNNVSLVRGSGGIQTREFVAESAPERTVLTSDVSDAERRNPEFETDLREAYESFSNSYDRARDEEADRAATSRMVEGRDPEVDRRIVSGRIEPGNDPANSEEELRLQAERMEQLDPLFLYVNPDSFDKSYTHVISEKDTREFLVEQWGTELPTISASGTIGAFMVDYTNDRGEKTGGLATSLRRGSYAYQNLMSLYHAYRNNGYLYHADDKIGLVGAVRIFYDGAIYTGSFDSFSMSESEDAPFTMEYDFDFTVRFEQSLDSNPHV